MRPFIKSESWLAVSFCPHVASTEVFGINLITLYPSFGSFEGGVQHSEPGNQTISLYHSHLAIEVNNFKLWRSPYCSEGRIWGSIHAYAGQGRLVARSGKSL